MVLVLSLGVLMILVSGLIFVGLMACLRILLFIVRGCWCRDKIVWACFLILGFLSLGCSVRGEGLCLWGEKCVFSCLLYSGCYMFRCVGVSCVAGDDDE